MKKEDTALCDRFDVASSWEATTAASVNFLRQIFVYHDLTHAENEICSRLLKKIIEIMRKSNTKKSIANMLNIFYEY